MESYISYKRGGVVLTPHYVNTTSAAPFYQTVEYLRNRERWIIVFTDNFNSDLKDDSIRELCNFFKSKDPWFNVLIIGINVPLIDKERANLLLNFNKSAIIDFDDFSKLRNILKIMGVIRNDIIFPNENYDVDRKIN